MKSITCYLKKPEIPDVYRSQVKALVPALIADQAVSVLMPIVNTAMTAYADTSVLAGMALASSVCNILTAIISALTIGSTVLAAQLHGKDDSSSLTSLVAQTGIYGALLSALIAFVCLLSSSFVLPLLFSASDPAVLLTAETYYRWSVLSLPFAFITAHVSGLFRSAGDSGKPLIFGIFTNIINIILGYFLIVGLPGKGGYGAAGAGITIFVSRLLGAVLSFLFLAITSLPIKFRLNRRSLSNSYFFRKALPIGLASASENLLYYTGRMLLQLIISTEGTIAVAANQVVLSIHQFAIIVPTAFSTATFTVIGQSYGKKDEEGCQKWEHYLGFLSQYICMATAVLLVIFAKPVCSLITSDQEVVLAAVPALMIETISLLCWTRAVIPGVAIKSCGHYQFPFLLNSATMWIFQVAFVYLISKPYGAAGVWAGYVISTAVRALLYLWYLKQNRWALYTDQPRNNT